MVSSIILNDSTSVFFQFLFAESFSELVICYFSAVKIDLLMNSKISDYLNLPRSYEAQTFRVMINYSIREDLAVLLQTFHV